MTPVSFVCKINTWQQFNGIKRLRHANDLQWGHDRFSGYQLMQYKHILHYSADPGIDLFSTYYVHAWVLNSGLQILAVKDRHLWVPCIDINYIIIWIQWFSLLFTVN